MDMANLSSQAQNNDGYDNTTVVSYGDGTLPLPSCAPMVCRRRQPRLLQSYLGVWPNKCRLYGCADEGDLDYYSHIWEVSPTNVGHLDVANIRCPLEESILHMAIRG